MVFQNSITANERVDTAVHRSRSPRRHGGDTYPAFTRPSALEQVARFLTGNRIAFEREATFNLYGEDSVAYVDYVVYRDFGTVLIQVDEHQHKNHSVSCEAACMLNIFAEQLKQGKAGKVHIIRFNPDAYQRGGQRATKTLNRRLPRLVGAIQHQPVQQYSVTYLYYDHTDSPLPDICFDPEYPCGLRELVNR